MAANKKIYIIFDVDQHVGIIKALSKASNVKSNYLFQKRKYGMTKRNDWSVESLYE